MGLTTMYRDAVRTAAGVLLGSSLLVGGVQANTINISGATPPFPGYGTAIGQNNVVNSGLSGVTDSHSGTTFLGSATGNPAVVTTSLPLYNVDWYFVGSESGYTNTLTAPGINASANLPNSPVAGQFNEGNQNSNCCSSPSSPGPIFLGTSTGQTNSVLQFSLADGHVPSIANGSSNPNAGSNASIIFSYVTNPSALTWALSSDATSSWFLFGFNDSGADADFDDFVGVARVYCGTPQGAACDPPLATPLPAALPLFAGGLGVIGLLARRRKRKAAVTVA